MSLTNFIMLISLSMLLFILGIYGLTSKNSAIKALMSIEIIVASININFIAFGFALTPGKADPQAQTFVILILSISGSIIGFAIALILNIRNKYGTINLSKLTNLRW